MYIRILNKNKMELREVEGEDIEELYQLGDSFGSLFSHSSWIKLFDSDKILRLGFYEKDDRLIGGVYLLRKRFFVFEMLTDFSFSPHIDIFYSKQNKNNSKKNSFVKQLTFLFVQYLEKRNQVFLFSFGLNPEHKDVQPFLWNNFKVSLKYTYRIDLSIIEIDKLYSPERRNDIKKAKIDGIVVKQTKDCNVLLNLIKKTFTRQHKSVDVDFIEKLVTSFSDNNSFIFTAYDKRGIPLSSCFFVYDRSHVYYLLSGYNNDFKHHGAGPLCIDEAIKYSKSLGMNVFDFEGSMQPQIEKYFRGFGGDLIYYPYINKSYLLFEMILKLKLRRLF